MKGFLKNRDGCPYTPLVISLAVAAFCALLTVGMQQLCLADTQETSIDFTSLDLEELKQVMIVSVSKKPERLSEAAAAISVITQEDIRRSGYTSIPDVLRQVPGLQVAQINSNTWAVSSRGFNHRYANKLLVLIDGRSVYTPMFSGVYWHVQDMLMEDIERIEVIRGPGATLWGANAVNGVINILTKHAKDTLGGLVTAGGGGEEQGFGGARYGLKLGRDAYIRAYIKYSSRDDFRDEYSNDGNDDWDSLKAGFRLDWAPSGNNAFTLQGDIYNGDAGERPGRLSALADYIKIIERDNDFSGGNILLRWKHTFSETSDMAVQFYYDRTRQKDDFNIALQNRYVERFDTFDADFQHTFRCGRSHRIIWGLGYRLIMDHFTDDRSPIYSFDPDHRNLQLFNAFLQDEISLYKDRLRLTFGVKFEHNDYTGFEVQPNARLLWKVSDRQVLWASFSRAVRTPSRSENDADTIDLGVIPLYLPTTVSVVGDNHVKAEELLAFEMGYRLQFTQDLFLDLALYYNAYDNFRSLEPGLLYADLFHDIPHFVLPLYVDNVMEAQTYGLEIAATWDMFPWWQLLASYTYINLEMHNDSDSFNAFNNPPEEFNPHGQFFLRSSWDLPWNLACDVTMRYVDNLSDAVDSYCELDARIAWEPLTGLDFSIVGHNLIDNHHPEFVASRPGGEGEVERSVFGKITWRF